MDRFTGVLAGLLGRSARLLPAARREWAEAVLAEMGEIPGGCETCDPVNTVIPPSLRHEYWVEISVGQAGIVPLAFLLFAPFVGAGIGAFAGGFANRSRGTRGRAGGGPHAVSPPVPSQPLGRLRASDADREQAIGVLKAAFAQGRLTKGEFDARVGHVFTSETCADLAGLTADIPPG